MELSESSSYVKRNKLTTSNKKTGKFERQNLSFFQPNKYIVKVYFGFKKSKDGIRGEFSKLAKKIAINFRKLNELTELN